MAVSAAAALLDELMGRNRNDGPNAQKKPVHWEDRSNKYILLISVL